MPTSSQVFPDGKTRHNKCTHTPAKYTVPGVGGGGKPVSKMQAITKHLPCLRINFHLQMERDNVPKCISHSTLLSFESSTVNSTFAPKKSPVDNSTAWLNRYNFTETITKRGERGYVSDQVISACPSRAVKYHWTPQLQAASPCVSRQNVNELCNSHLLNEGLQGFGYLSSVVSYTNNANSI
jgi:hypothetical protein